MRPLRPSLLLALPLVTASPAAPQGFVEVAAGVGLAHEFFTGFDRFFHTNVFGWTQAGVALGDLDGNGWIDVVAAGGVGRNSVFLNDGGVFTKLPLGAGIEVGEYDRAVTLGDYDADGDLDLFVGALDREVVSSGAISRLYANDGTGSFTEVTTLSATFGGGHTIFATWFDVDRDGLLDLYLGEFIGGANIWYRNEGDGTFADLGEKTGLDSPGSAHSISFFDADDDGYYDCFVGNDHQVNFATGTEPNAGDFHLQGQPDGTFLDVTPGSNYGHEAGIMGHCVVDVDYDGDPDIYKSDAGENRLMLNEGWPGSGVPWSEEQYAYGIEIELLPNPEMPGQFLGDAISWGAYMGDLDRDLWMDLFCVNGDVPGGPGTVLHTVDQEQNFYFQGLGPAGGFGYTDVTEAVGLLDFVDDRGLAVGDYDRDGDLDLFVSPLAGLLRVYENQLTPLGGWLLVEPLTRTSAPNGIGTVVSWTDSGGFPHKRWIGSDATVAGQHDTRAFFGLGAETAVDVTVSFPSGIEITYPAVPADTHLVAEEPRIFGLETRSVLLSPPAGTGAASAGFARTGGAAAPAGAQGSQGHPGLEPELFPVTVFAHDAAGNELDGTAVVEITAEGLEPAGPVEHVQANEFRRSFRYPAEASSHRVTATIDGWEVGIRPRIVFVGQPDGGASTTQLLPRAVRAGSSDTYVVELAPKDELGHALGAGLSVEVARTDGTGFLPMADLGNGIYARTLSAPADAGTYFHTFRVGSAQLPPTADLDCAGAPSGFTTSATIETPPIGIGAVNYGEPYQMRLEVTPRDAKWRRLGPKAQVSVAVLPDTATVAPAVRTDLGSVSQRDGGFAYVLQRPEEAASGTSSGFLRVVAEGVVVAFVPYSF